MLLFKVIGNNETFKLDPLSIVGKHRFKTSLVCATRQTEEHP